MLRKFNESKCIDLSILSTIFVSVKFIMNKKSILFFFVLLSTSFYSLTQKADSSKLKLLNSMIDSWHANASKANFNEYFDVTTDNFVFLGTDLIYKRLSDLKSPLCFKSENIFLN